VQRATSVDTAYVEVLTEDDDDGNLANGTPNQCAIDYAFGTHGFGPARSLFGEGLEAHTRDRFTISMAEITPASGCPIPPIGSIEIYWQLRDNPETNGTVPMELDAGAYSGTIPTQAEGSVIEYRITVIYADGNLRRFPINVSDTFYEFFNGDIEEIYCTDFESDPLAEGWVATGDAGFIEKSSGHLRIIDRAKDVGKLQNGQMFAPKFVENKLKFYPDILEAVVFGKDRANCVAFINIDLNAVGNWAERNNIGYASYQELAGHPQVLDTIQAHVTTVNASVAEDEMLSGCQVHRFVVLHKELDADDGEMTRTRKVRRAFVNEKFSDIIEAMYDGFDKVSTETEVTYEDGRKGAIKATLDIRDPNTSPAASQKGVAE